MTPLKTLLSERDARTKWPHKMYYRPFSREDSQRLREHYRSDLAIPLTPTAGLIRNSEGTVIATAYNRVVVGDYGAFIEVSEKDMVLANIKSKWPGEPKRPVKYLWMETVDSTRTKVYQQRRTVSYADYKPGMYYVDPAEVEVNDV